MVSASIDRLEPPLPGEDDAHAGGVLAGLRRLTQLADAAGGEQAVYAGLARELMRVLGAEEVHVHELLAGEEQDLVVVHLLRGDGRLSYLQRAQERPPGVDWAQRSGRSFLAIGPRELSASVPRLTSGAPAGEQAPSCALIVPLALAGEIEAVVVLVRRASLPYEEPALEQAETLVDHAATVLALARARSEAGTDSVAGCMNHRAMRLRLAEEIGRAQRSGGQLSCAIVDLDDFKLVNDRFGHLIGDTVLRQAAQALMGEFRAFDRVARYGGDEFVVILPSADLDSAVVAGERALARVRAVSLPDGSAVSASMGVAQWSESMSVDELLSACDAALLRGKRSGKGCVTGAPSFEAGPPGGERVRAGDRRIVPLPPRSA
ncbi:MAG TPA: GGDEF domain-containing protein [Solirubrobacteraceae bacterium]|jgi:diguanylate cyclase (GGDEF)-like protein|nr:GGDEF domain-containing protein [Solirubrobacteraceae bacterium]